MNKYLAFGVVSIVFVVSVVLSCALWIGAVLATLHFVVGSDLFQKEVINEICNINEN